jgi:RHS repeat-associated protein
VRTVWIGGIYEVRNNGNQVLCHVYAGGMRVCTFEPSGAVCAWFYQHPVLGRSYDYLVAAVNWPLQGGRAPYTVLLIPLLGVLCVSVVSRRCSSHRLGGTSPATLRRHSRRWGWYLAHDPIASSPLRRFSVSLINVVLIVAFFVAVMPVDVAACNCPPTIPVFWYYHGDSLGSSNVLTDRSGCVVKHYEYLAFGKERFNDATLCAFNVANRYTGQILDDETGLYYYNARYYDPEIGRFIQADTIVPNPANPQSLNRYSYVLNNPLKYTDPTGHENFFTGLGGALKAAFSNPQTWATLAIGGIAGPVGVLMAAVLVASIATDNYVFGQVFGEKAGAIHAAVGQIVMGVYTIVVGVFMTAAGIYTGNGFLIAAGILTIASGALTIASAAASLSGNESLAEDLGWAAFGTGVAATAVGLAAGVAADHAEASGGPEYDPSAWNDEGRVQNSTNCYAYALDKKGPFPPDHKLQPGEMSGDPIGDDFSADDIRSAAIRDGLLSNKGARGAYRVQYYMGDVTVDGRVIGRDYHWYRQDASGLWSHKPGHGAVTNLDAKGRLIVDPRTSARDFSTFGGRVDYNYSKYGGELWVPKGF